MPARASVRGTVLTSCAAACLMALPAMSVSASATYTTVNATWTGGGGDWTDGADWSSNPNYADNGTPSDTVYNATIASGGVYLDNSVNVDNLTLGAADQILTIGAGGILNLSQPDNGGISGTLSAGPAGILLAGGTLADATLVSPAGSAAEGSILVQNGGTVQNITLGSDFAVQGSDPLFGSTLSVGSAINLNGYTLQLQNITADFQYASPTGGGDVVDNGTMDVSGLINAAGLLGLGSHATLAFSNEAGISGDAFTNSGNITVQNGQAFINSSSFTNAATGVITVDSGSSLNIASANWVNNGLIQTSNAVGTSHSGGATLDLNGSWTNNGTINIASGDFIFYGSIPSVGGTGAINDGGGQAVGPTNTGSINVGSSSITGVAATIMTPYFRNSGNITVYSGNILQFGNSSVSYVLDQVEPSVTWTNTGTIQTDNANSSGIGEIPSTAQLTFYGNWSNTGTIAAGQGNTIDLGGSFHPSDVGLASSGTNSVFRPNGANVVFNGTLINTNNNLVFGPSSGVWNADGGVIEGGTLSVMNQVDGTPYFNGNFHVEGVTLGSDLTVTRELFVSGVPYGGVTGLQANGHTIELNSGDVTFSSYTSGYAFAGTINIYGQAASVDSGGDYAVTLASSAVINVLAPAQGAYGNPTIGGFYANYGTVNVGSPTVSGVVPSIAFEHNYGTITVYTGDTAQLDFFTANNSIVTNNGTLRALVGGVIRIMPAYATPTTAEFSSGSTFGVQLGSAGASGLLSVDGNLQLDSGSALSLSQLASSTSATPYDIINYTGTLTGTFTDVTPGYVLDYTSHPGEILVTAVPEPAALAIFAVGLAGLGLRQRKNAKPSVAA